MIVSRGLVGPKTHPNRSGPKGKQVNIPVLARGETDARGQHRQARLPAQANSTAEKRHVEKPCKMR
jgi:hypothetical protein